MQAAALWPRPNVWIQSYKVSLVRSHAHEMSQRIISLSIVIARARLPRLKQVSQFRMIASLIHLVTMFVKRRFSVRFDS
jgi:hypothetical protein